MKLIQFGKRVVIVVLSSLFSHLAFSQNYSPVKGTIIDTRGEAIIGANILLKGQKSGSISDINGHFSLAAPEQGILQVSYIGYLTEEIPIKGQKRLRIVLHEDSKSLDEVVVIGYGSMAKRDLTSSIVKADIQNIANVSVGNVTDALGGRMAGVQVSSLSGQPGEDSEIIIRGGNSITSSSTPLYVIDGFAMSSDYTNTLNPNDIESLEVLKDASATAIYGARGANGVIMITTKKGKLGKPSVEYRGYWGMQTTNAKVDVLSPYEFVQVQQKLSRNWKKDYLTDRNLSSIEAFHDIAAINYMDLLLRDAQTTSHSLSLTGGTQDTKYLVSGSYLNQDGVIIGSNYERFTGRIVLDQNFGKKVKFNLSANFSYGVQNGTNPNSWNSNLLQSAWSYRPFSMDGSDDPAEEGITDPNDRRNNPILQVKNEYSKRMATNLRANSYIEYEPISGLKLKAAGGLSNDDMEREAYNNQKTLMGRTRGYANGSFSSDHSFNYSGELTANYAKTFRKKHKVTALVGWTVSGREAKSKSSRVDKVYRDDLGFFGINEGTPTAIAANASSWTLASAIARATYGFDNRYLFSLSFRADGSSKFGSLNRWAYFPSGSAAWVISQEQFMKPLRKLFSNIKLRASWGRTGNNNVSDFAAMGSIYSANTSGIPYYYYFGNMPNNAAIKTSLGNPDLKWETTEQTDIGVDIGLLNQRIRLEVDYFIKNTSDLLLNADLAFSSGFPTAYMNIGEVQNQGFEFSISSDNIRNKNFRWTTDFNISFIRNKVVKLTNEQPSMTRNVSWSTTSAYEGFNNIPAYIAEVGKPLSLMYGLISEGLLTNEDIANGYPTDRGTNVHAGYMKFRDINGDGIIDMNDRTVIGSANPDFFGGMNNKFTFYGFDLSIFLQFSVGNDILNANRFAYTVGNPYGYNSSKAILNSFSPLNPTGIEPVIGSQRSVQHYSSYWVEDGSFLKLKNVQLGYTFPTKWIKTIGMKNIRLYCSFENLYTLTRYSGFDPEVSVYNSAMTRGMDFSSYPRAFSATVGANISF